MLKKAEDFPAIWFKKSVKTESAMNFQARLLKTSCFIVSGGFGKRFQFLVVVFIKIKTTGNHQKFKFYGVEATPESPFIPAVPLNASKGSLGLYTAIHHEKITMHTFEIVYHFCMKAGKLPVDSYYTLIALTFITFRA